MRQYTCCFPNQWRELVKKLKALSETELIITFVNSLALNQFNTAHTSIRYFKIHFNITVTCHLRLSLSSGPFSLDFHAEILLVFLSYHLSRPARRRDEPQSGHGRFYNERPPYWHSRCEVHNQRAVICGTYDCVNSFQSMFSH